MAAPSEPVAVAEPLAEEYGDAVEEEYVEVEIPADAPQYECKTCGATKFRIDPVYELYEVNVDGNGPEIIEKMVELRASCIYGHHTVDLLDEESIGKGLIKRSRG